jgi:ATP-dependent Clp protease ATP-binding subunit ClpC
VFDTFERDARRVVVLAQDEARLLDHGYVGTEHLLLGVLALDGPMADALGELGVSIEAARDQIEEVIGPDGGSAVRRHLPFTPRAKSVLELSLREALRLDHSRIRPAHVVLGLVREGEGVACQVLLWLTRDLEAVRTAAERVARADEALTPAWREAGIELGEAPAVVAALVEAFGDEVRLMGFRVRRSGSVQAAVHLPGQPGSTVVTVERADGGWVVTDRSA